VNRDGGRGVRRGIARIALGALPIGLAAALAGCGPGGSGSAERPAATTATAAATAASTATATATPTPTPTAATARGGLPPASPVRPDPAAAEPAARGAYLALAGNCAGCHTVRGGEPYAGGRAIATPFGTIHATNLTPDAETGLGAWSAEDFRRALHEGRSRDGRALYPAFPYTDYTRVSAQDADALFAFLRTLPPVRAATPPPALRFPWNLPALLEAWRWLYFRPGRFEADPARDADWNRGAYLVTGLGHCGACHTARNALGGPSGPPLGGGPLDAIGWHAPSLLDDREGGFGGRSLGSATAWLATGLDGDAIATGPMARVVVDSLQHLSDADRRAMAAYLRGLPTVSAVGRTDGPSWRRPVAPPGAATLELGEALYRRHCEDCHGAEGLGGPPHWPALAGNRAVTSASPVNLVRSLLHGGFAPATRTNPQPYGMPPFGPQLDDAEAAALATWLRQAWGHRASPVDARTVNALRPVPIH
jgi:mono/diheme cytochrome c family protein